MYITISQYFIFFVLDKTFVTILRNNGVPSSLNVISNKIGNGGPLLEPYPNWSWAENQNCSGITSVYRVAVIKNCFHIGITIDFYNIKDTLYEYIII